VVSWPLQLKGSRLVMPIQLVYLFCIGYSSSLCRVCTLVQSETLVVFGKISAQALLYSDLLHAHTECHTSTSILRQSKRTEELAHKSTMMCYNSTSSQKATGCSNKLAGGQKIRSCSKTMLQLTKPRGTCNASTTPSREGTFWNGPKLT